MKFAQNLVLFTAILAIATGCGRRLGGDTVTSNATVGKVVYGTVISTRQVTVKDSERLQDNAIGGLAGGVAGGVAGSGIGGGTGKGLATVGGAILGAVAGAAIQDELGTSSGTEYVVLLDGTKSPTNVTQKKDYRFTGSNSVKNDINQSIQLDDQATQTIAVVQQDEVPLTAGTRVLVIYSDDRPRVVAAPRQ
jgi:outer membrane lipoprotein SlyB